MKELRDQSYLVWLAFLTSFSTLLCCTIPIILVFFGMGATLAALSSYIGWWIVLSKYKFWLFFLSAIVLTLSFWMMKKSPFVCPTDPVFAKKCMLLRRVNQVIFTLSVIIWLIGFFSAYILAPLVAWLGV